MASQHVSNPGRALRGPGADAERLRGKNYRHRTDWRKSGMMVPLHDIELAECRDQRLVRAYQLMLIPFCPLPDLALRGPLARIAIRKNAATEFIDTKRKPGFGPG
jgi:hypothetical protein